MTLSGLPNSSQWQNPDLNQNHRVHFLCSFCTDFQVSGGGDRGIRGALQFQNLKGQAL